MFKVGMQVLVVLSLAYASCQQILAQQPHVERRLDGWSRFESTDADEVSRRGEQDRPLGARVANYYPQEGLPALPDFPPSSMSSPPPNGQSSAPPPSLSPSNQSGSSPPTLPASAMPPPTLRAASGTPTSPPRQSPNAGAVLPPRTPTSPQTNTLPPAGRPRASGGPMPNALRGNGNLPSSQAGFGPPPQRQYPSSSQASNTQNVEVAYQTPPANANLRRIENGKSTPNGRLDPSQIATGLPYVTPAPRGKYPTSPYNHALFSNAAYRRQAASSTRPTTTAQTVANNRPAATTGQPNFQGQPGIYPTAYQQGAPFVRPETNTSQVATPPPAYQPQHIYAGNNAGYAPVMSMGQERYNVQLGRGLVGQPTVYVTGQPIRNFLRYIFP